MNKQNITYKNNRITYNICETGLLMGLTLGVYYLLSSLSIGQLISFDIHWIFYILGIIVIKDKSFRLFFFFSIPFLSMFRGNIIAINHFQVFVEYFLVYYCFFLFLFFNWLTDKKSSKVQFVVFVSFLIISFFIRLMLHTISGILWWGANSFEMSILINIRILILDWIVVVPLTIITYPSLKLFYKQQNKK
ncbi:MAG: hypothetical protein ACRDCF_01640 [Mycoplasmoidaceae bacterium]